MYGAERRLDKLQVGHGSAAYKNLAIVRAENEVVEKPRL